MEPEPAVLFTFGVISDVQYADIDNRLNYSQTCMRFYRNALVLLREAIDHWTEAPTDRRPEFVVHLGDLIDGFNADGGKQRSLKSLDEVMAEFDRLPCFTHHLIGNHEYYNFTRAEVMASRLFTGSGFETPGSGNPDCRCSASPISPDSEDRTASPAAAPYYHFSPLVGFRFVVLHSYEQSVIGHETDVCPIYRESLHQLRSVNSNEDVNSPLGLVGVDRRFVAYNGGIGEAQRKWLREVLEGATAAKEKVVVFGHIPIYPAASHYSCLTWDYLEVLNLLRSFPCVRAVLSGHTHDYLHNVDGDTGIHFLSLPGIVEIVPGTNGFGTVQVYADKLVLHGVGKLPSIEMAFPNGKTGGTASDD